MLICSRLFWPSVSFFCFFFLKGHIAKHAEIYQAANCSHNMAIMPLSYSWKGPTPLELDAFLCISDSYLSVGAEKLEKRQEFWAGCQFSLRIFQLHCHEEQVTHVWITWCWLFDRLVKLSNDTQLMCSQVHYCTTSQTFLCFYQQETTGGGTENADRVLTDAWKQLFNQWEKRARHFFALCSAQ